MAFGTAIVGQTPDGVSVAPPSPTATVLPAPPVATSTATSDDVAVRWIRATAHRLSTTDPAGPLDDLNPLARMVGRAELVGLGEATQGSREICRIKQRMVEYLIRHLGFTGLVMDVPWPDGQQLDDYVLHGTGDPHAILSSFPWNSQEVADVFVWMRGYNADSRHRRKLRIAGMEVGSSTPAIFDGVTGFVRTAGPDLLQRIRKAYAPLRAAPSVAPADILTPEDRYAALPQATKAQYAAQAEAVIGLLRQEEAVLVRRGSKKAFAWALQNAREIFQFAHEEELFGENPGGAFTYREQAMAENAGWWHDQIGNAIIWAHDEHVARRKMTPPYDPDKTMGGLLSERFGDRYLSIGTSFGRGGYLAIRAEPGKGASGIVSVTVGPPTPGSSNAILDQGGPDLYLLDLRMPPDPVRAWLSDSRPFRMGSASVVDDPQWLEKNAYGNGALGQWFDVLVHLRQVSAAHPPHR